MLAFVMASLMVVTDDPTPQPAAAQKDEPALVCRELGSASSRSEAIRICKTRAQWLERDACTGPTRYCAPVKRVAMIAFPMDENSRIICRKLSVTGTRLKTISTCLPQREWDRMHSNGREEVSELQDNYSKLPNRGQ